MKKRNAKKGDAKNYKIASGEIIELSRRVTNGFMVCVVSI